MLSASFYGLHIYTTPERVHNGRANTSGELKMNKQFIKIDEHIINVSQITHLYRCDNGVSIYFNAPSTEPKGTLEADCILIIGGDAEIVWAYFSSMMITHTLLAPSIRA